MSPQTRLPPALLLEGENPAWPPRSWSQHHRGGGHMVSMLLGDHGELVGGNEWAYLRGVLRLCRDACTEVDVSPWLLGRVVRCVLGHSDGTQGALGCTRLPWQLTVAQSTFTSCPSQHPPSLLIGHNAHSGLFAFDISFSARGGVRASHMPGQCSATESHCG